MAGASSHPFESPGAVAHSSGLRDAADDGFGAGRLGGLERLASLGLLAVGAAALWLTGEIAPPVVVGFVVAWALAVARMRLPQRWQPWGGRLLVAVALTAIARVALGLHFAAVLYLVAFLGLHKAFALRNSADHLHLLLLAFFMILAASIITQSAAFLAVLLAFVALAWVQLTCLTLLRAAETVGSGPGIAMQAGEGGPGSDPASTPPRIGRLVVSGAVGALATLAGAAILFFTLPHWRTGGLSHARLIGLTLNTPTASIGYSDNVTLEPLAAIEPDRAVALYLEVRRPWFDPGPLPPSFHLRGRVLDEFDGRGWSATPGTTLASARWERLGLPVLSAYHGAVVQQYIRQDVGVTSRLFGADIPFEFDFSIPNRLGGRQVVEGDPLRLLLDWRGRALAVAAPRQGMGPAGSIIIDYGVTSFVAPDAIALLMELAQTPPPDQLGTLATLGRGVASSLGWQGAGLRGGTAGPNDGVLILDPVSRRVATALPEWSFGGRLAEIADRVMTRPDEPGRIVQLNDWIQENFTYSLRPDTPRGMQPIEAFLTRTFKGHCEYFATGMALLLRAKGIPARVVTGYYAWENAFDRPGFVVRQSDAHAWTEVWLDGYGWLLVDPSPREMRGQGAFRIRPEDGLWRRLRVAARSFWQRHVIGFTEDQQIDVWSIVLASDFVQFFKDLLSPVVEVITEGPIPTPPLGGRAPAQAGRLWLQTGLIVALVGIVAWLLVYDLQRRRRSAQPAVAQSTVPFMNQILRRLARMGWRRRAGQTSAEFLAEIERQTAGGLRFDWCLDLYHRYRYAQQPRDRRAEARIWQAIREMSTKDRSRIHR